MISYSKDNYWKIWNIISDRLIYNWFKTILRNWKNSDFSYFDFIPSNLVLWKDNTIKKETKNYITNKEQCIENYSEYSYYDEYFHECNCYDWFEWWEDNTCILSSEAINVMFELWKQSCIEKYWDKSIFIYDPINEEFTCNCQEWYELWWKDNNKCIIKLSEKEKWDIACKKVYWENSIFNWEKEWNKFICSCEEWYKFWKDKKSCVSK
jgi:hypothetical protein